MVHSRSVLGGGFLCVLMPITSQGKPGGRGWSASRNPGAPGVTSEVATPVIGGLRFLFVFRIGAQIVGGTGGGFGLPVLGETSAAE